MSQSRLLQVSDLHVSYGRIKALAGVFLDVAEGEIVGVVGSNGAGKSTLLSTIGGVLSPAVGEIAFEGRSIVGLAPESIVRTGVSLVPEGRRILGTLSVEENLRLGATCRADRHSVEEDLEDVVDMFPILGNYLRSPARGLSGGEQQQLAIGRALMARPKLLLLDEPSLGLAPLLVNLVFSKLEELRENGVTILVVEQNAARTVEVATRIYVLRGGTVDFHGTSEEVKTRFDLAQAYLGA
jgi:branched-chain amino acid transport system ATP-binding protein